MLPFKLNPLGINVPKLLDKGSVSCDSSVVGAWLIHEDVKSEVTVPSAFTVSVWCRTLSSPTKGGVFRFGGQHQPGVGIGFGFGSDQFVTGHEGTNLVMIEEGRSWHSHASASNLTEWHHYVVTQGASYAKVYVDGVLSWTQSSSPNRTPPPSNFIFGGGDAKSIPTSTSRALSCHITRGAMWNVELTAQQALQDYQDGLQSPSILNGLIHFWPMSSKTNYLKDQIGDWDFTTLAPVKIVNDIPSQNI